MEKYDNQKKILHLIVGLGDGGAEATLYKIVINDENSKHVVISLTDFGKYGNYLLKYNVKTYCLNLKKNYKDFFKIFRLLKVIFLEKPSIIQTWMYHSDFLSFFIKIFFPKSKIIWSIRNTTYKLKDSKTRFIISKFCAFFSYFIPIKIIACGERAKTDHINFGYTKKKWTVIYNGVDTKKFKPNKNLINSPYLFQKTNNNLNLKVLGMVARFDKQKGFDILLKSLKKLSEKKINFLCILVGKNVDNNNLSLKTRINNYNLNDNVFLFGQRNDLELFYNAIDISILSSINGEGFPNVLIESMACGTPCISTDVGESKKIIGSTGWLARPNDVKSLSSKIEEALLEINTINWNIKTKEARNRVIKKFDLEIMVHHYISVWNKTLMLDS